MGSCYNNSQTFTSIKYKLGYNIASPWAPADAFLYWGHDFDFKGHRDHRGRIRFPEHLYSKRCGAINLKRGRDTCLGSDRMPDDLGWAILNFEVTE